MRKNISRFVGQWHCCRLLWECWFFLSRSISSDKITPSPSLSLRSQSIVLIVVIPRWFAFTSFFLSLFFVSCTPLSPPCYYAALFPFPRRSIWLVTPSSLFPSSVFVSILNIIFLLQIKTKHKQLQRQQAQQGKEWIGCGSSPIECWEARQMGERQGEERREESRGVVWGGLGALTDHRDKQKPKTKNKNQNNRRKKERRRRK